MAQVCDSISNGPWHLCVRARGRVLNNCSQWSPEGCSAHLKFGTDTLSNKQLSTLHWAGSRCHFRRAHVSHRCCVKPGSPIWIFRIRGVFQMTLGTDVWAAKSDLTFPVTLMDSHDFVLSINTAFQLCVCVSEM